MRAKPVEKKSIITSVFKDVKKFFVAKILPKNWRLVFRHLEI